MNYIYKVLLFSNPFIERIIHVRYWTYRSNEPNFLTDCSQGKVTVK